MDKVSISYLISFPRYQTKLLLSSSLESWWYDIINFKILGSTSKVMADSEKKTGR